MAASESESYPRLAPEKWWDIRARLAKSLPPRIDESYLTSVYGGQPTSARSNIMRPLRRMGLIDDEAKRTARADKWRHDEDYSDVCKEILEEVYPLELRESFADPEGDAEAITRWFASHGGKGNSGVGQQAASQMATMYRLLLFADPSQAASRVAKKPKTSSSVKETSAKSRQAKPRPELTTVSPPSSPPVTSVTGSVQQAHLVRPNLHIDVQIHIASDASESQIEAIFSNMAKYLYGDGA